MRALILSTVVALARLAACAASSAQQSLDDTLSAYPNFSSFRNLLSLHPNLVSSVLNGSTSPVTVLVPTNDAFTKFLSQRGRNLSSFNESEILPFARYHFVLTRLSSSNFTGAGGLTVPSFLNQEAYDNRTAGDALTNQFGNDAMGQVVYFSNSAIGPAKVKARQSQTVNVRGGRAGVAQVTFIDGVWSGGVIHSVDSVLNPPVECSATARGIPDLTSLDTALNRTKLWQTLDHTPNVTCLAPNNPAFAAAGDPQSVLNTSDLTGALMFHTLPMPIYSNYLYDGQMITSLANLTVKVTINSTGTFFNDAMVVSPNVLTNNGVIHVLNKVMSPLSMAASPSAPTTAAPTATTGAPGASSSGASASSTSSHNAAATPQTDRSIVGVVAFAGAALALL